MLKFDVWPPEAGKVTFSASSLDLIESFQRSPQTTECEELLAVHDMSRYAGRVVAANTDMEIACQIEKDLYCQLPAEGRVREVFNLAFLMGAGVEDIAEASRGVTA